MHGTQEQEVVRLAVPAARVRDQVRLLEEHRVLAERHGALEALPRVDLAADLHRDVAAAVQARVRRPTRTGLHAREVETLEEVIDDRLERLAVCQRPTGAARRDLPRPLEVVAGLGSHEHGDRAGGFVADPNLLSPRADASAQRPDRLGPRPVAPVVVRGGAGCVSTSDTRRPRR
jgi:hypothetical protein